MVISLVIPIFNEADNIPLLGRSIIRLAGELSQHRFEAVLVDDGSTDGTSEIIAKLEPAKNITWKMVQLSRNFGQQAAISAGISQAEGDVLIILDADLQDPPELIPAFLQKFSQGYEVVYGIRQDCKEALWKRFCCSAFYRLINALAERPIPLDAGDFSLISKRVAKLIAGMPECDRFIRGMRNWVGFKQIGIPYERPKRWAGTSGYDWSRLFELALDGLWGFSKVPIRMALLIGLAIVLLGGLYLVTACFNHLFIGGDALPGWKLLIALGFMAVGANILVTSIVGEYVVRVYFQTKSRPLYVVEKVVTKAPG